jgi:hypothetical protein
MSEDGEHPYDGRPVDKRPSDLRLVGGRYRLVERIGSGGMGTVWRAFDERVEREVAVKQPRLPGDPDDDEHQRAAHRLSREARAAARVDHPAAVLVHDVVIEDGLPWIVMELVRGESLHEMLRRGRLEPAESARIGLAVLGALSAAHAVGIVHRDVKPANVLLGPNGRVVLTDFGIAHVQGEESLTASGEFVGSLEFVAPERMSGTGAGPSSDLWSLGVLLYAAVEGASPFRRTTVESTLGAVLAADPAEPKHAGPLGPLLARLLVKDPELRPGAEEVGTTLEAVAEGRAVPDAATEPPHDAHVRAHTDAVPEARLTDAVPEARLTDAVPEERPADAVPVADPEPPHPHPQRTPKPRILRRAAIALLGICVLGGIGFGTLFAEVEGGATTTSATAATAATAPRSSNAWIAHREKALKAVLSLPPPYRRLKEQGSGSGADPRTVVYGSGESLRVRLTEWDIAPGTAQAEGSLPAEGKSPAQYTRTSFHGRDALLVDLTYEPGGTPTRIMALIVRTTDNRMYELRVDMPKGTADEKKGTAVFKGARGRLTLVAK